MNYRELRGVAIGKIALAVLVFAGITVAELVGILIVFALDVPDTSLWSSTIPELLGALVAVAGMALMGGSSFVKPSREDIDYTFRFGWWCLAVGAGLFVLEMFDYLPKTPISTDWPSKALECTVFCLGVGVLEECMFRGVVFNGLLALFGGTHRGVVFSVLATSLLFGLAHIEVSEVFDLITATQALLKIVQTGMYSIMLCVIVLRTRKLVGVSLFHAVDDWLIVLPGVGLFGESFSTDYVTSGDEAIAIIKFYLIIIALYTPFLIKSLKELRRGQDVYYGAFMEHAIARAQERALAQEQARAVDSMQREMGSVQQAMPMGPTPPLNVPRYTWDARQVADGSVPPFLRDATLASAEQGPDRPGEYNVTYGESLTFRIQEEALVNQADMTVAPVEQETARRESPDAAGQDTPCQTTGEEPRLQNQEKAPEAPQGSVAPSATVPPFLHAATEASARPQTHDDASLPSYRDARAGRQRKRPPAPNGL